MIKGTIKTAAKLLLLLPILLFMVCVNYQVDVTGLFQGNQFERELAAKLLEGKAISNFQKLDERQILRLYIQNMPTRYDTLVVGSSRGLQITAAIAGETGLFYNAGMSGEDYYDLVGTVGLLAKYDRLPKNMILVLDPWILCGSVDSKNKLSDPNLANRFLSETLRFDVAYTEEDASQYAKALFDPDYFQSNVAYYFSDHTTEDKPSEVTGDVYKQKTEIKMTDGTLLYPQEFRTGSQDAVDWDAFMRAGMPFMMCGGEYSRLDENRCRQFEAVVDYLQENGVKLTFLLTPFHPGYYARVSLHMDTEGGVVYSEDYFKALAEEKDIFYCGSYDAAKVGCEPEDFYDGLHIRRESIGKFFFGIDSELI